MFDYYCALHASPGVRYMQDYGMCALINVFSYKCPLTTVRSTHRKVSVKCSALECVLLRLCSLATVFSYYCVLLLMCSPNVFSYYCVLLLLCSLTNVFS